MTAVRGWLEIDGEPALQVPCAKSVILSGDRLSMRFRRGCPEADAVLQGKKFVVGDSFVGNFEVKLLSSPSGTLKPLGSFSIDENDLKTAEISAYYLASETDAVTVSVVQQLTGSRQLVIEPGGKVQGSQDLVGKTVKVRCVYPYCITLSNEPVETITAHVVTLENDKFYYLKIRNSQIAKVGDRLLWLEFDPGDVVKVPIPDQGNEVEMVEV